MGHPQGAVQIVQIDPAADLDLIELSQDVMGGGVSSLSLPQVTNAIERLAQTLLGNQHPDEINIDRPRGVVRFVGVGQVEGGYELFLGGVELIVLEEHLGQHQSGVDDETGRYGLLLAVLQRRACQPVRRL